MKEQLDGLLILAFTDAASFEDWLGQQSTNSAGAWIKFAKQGARKSGLNKTEAIDAALCHGWIDGQLNKYDDEHWLVRFTPRKARSKWSQVNKTRASNLISEGRMRPAGFAQIEAARADGRWADAYAPASSATVPPDLQDALDANPEAARFFSTLKGANRYAIIYRIGSVKSPETRAKKIAAFIEMLERGETIHG
jgi:uncharacterized protein YdeI (YjbR/CyaY-like superfamily)